MSKGKRKMFLREILAVLMESPLYFTMSLQRRFAFIKDLEQRAYWPNLLASKSEGANKPALAVAKQKSVYDK